MATVTITSSQNISTVGYAAGDDLSISPGVTLTISATPSTPVRSIAATAGGGGKCIITNSSTSTMLKLEFTATLNGTAGYAALNFQNDCELQISGAFINIYTGNGAANQTVLANLNSVGGASVDFLSYIEVEESANVWEKYLLIPEAVANFEASEYSSVHTTGTVSSYNAGTQTVTITGAAPAIVTGQIGGKRFRTASMSEDAVISVATATTFTLINKDGSPYSGATPSGSFTVRDGACFERTDFSSGVMGRVLFLNPLTKEVQCGDGTRGNVIGNGMRVRVPNIYISQVTPTTTIAAGSSIPSSGTASFNLTSATGFPTTNSAYTNSTSRATLLIQDSATSPTVSERIGYTTISGTTVSATGMTRAAYNTLSKALISDPTKSFLAGASVKYIANSGYSDNAGLSRLNLSTGGSIVADTVMFGFGFSFSYLSTAINFAKKISLKRTGILGAVAAASGFSGDYIVDSCVFQRDCRHHNDTSNIYAGIATVSGITEVKNSVFFYPQNRLSSGTVYSCYLNQNANVAAFENNVSIFIRTYQGAHAAFGLFSINNCHIKNNYSVGRFFVANSENNLIEDTYVSSGPSEYTGLLTLDGAVTLGDYSDKNIVRGIRNIPNTSAYRGNLVSCFNFSSNNIVTNKGYATYDGTNNLSPTLFSDQGTSNTFGFLRVSNTRTGTSGMGSNAYNAGQKRVLCLVTTAYASPMLTTNTGPQPAMESEIDLQFGPQPFSTPPNTTFDSQPFVVCTTPGTVNEGYLCAGTFQPTRNWTGIFSGLSQTAYFNGDGALFITGAADAVEIFSKWPMRGISSFDAAGSITKIGTSQDTNALYFFKMSNWGDALPGSWTALTAANLEAARAALTGYSTSVGINFAMRVTTSVSSGTRNVRVVRMPIFWDTAYTPEVGTWNLDVTNVLTGSTVALSLNNGATWSQIKTAASSTVTLPVTSNWTGSTINYKLRVRKAGYDPIEISGSTKDDVAMIGATGLSIRVDQMQILDANGAAVYGNGTTSALVSLDYAALRIDIGNGSVSGPDLYDTVTNNAVNSTGIKYAWPISSPGLAGGFDVTVENTWKLRRKLVTDTNAAISKFVLYGPNPALSPVDTVNGTVALSHTFTMTVSGLLTGSAVALSTDGGASWSTTTAAGTSVTFPLVFTTYGGTINYTLRVRKAGYDSIESSGSVVYANITIPVTQAQTLDANGQPIYGTGTISALISIDATALRIDIGNGSINGPDFYDTVTAWACNTTGIQYAYPISSPGLAGYFDCTVENTWKLRRKLVTDTNAAISVFVLYGPNPALSPVDTVNGSVALSHTFTLAVTGSLSGSVLAMSLDGGSTWTTATSTGATVNFSVVFTTYGGTKNYIVRVRKAGYTPLEYSGSLVYQSGSVPAAQVQVVDINGVAVYGRGPGTTTAYINIVPGSLRVDIGNILVVGEDLYDYIAAWGATTTGIQYPEVLQFNGTDSIILNSFKLRRNVAGSTNAMIDMIVFYGPNTALNPVDEANGSVQLFPRVVRQGSLSTLGAAVWDYQTSSATTSGSMGERLKDASTVATTGQQLTAALTE